MKTSLLAAVLSLSCAAAIQAAPAEPSPSALVTAYFDALREGDLTALSALMHDEELVTFKTVMMPMIREAARDAASPGAEPEDVEAMRVFLGGETIGAIADEPYPAFFRRFMRWVLRLNPAMQLSVASSRVTPLGYVTENDMAHVVYRLHMVDGSGNCISQIGTMSARREGDGWKLMLTGEIENMAMMLQGVTGPAAGRPTGE